MVMLFDIDYGLDKKEKKDEADRPLPLGSYRKSPVPVIESEVDHYGGENTLGFTVPRDIIVLQNPVIRKSAYFDRMDPDVLKEETLDHEIGHNINPYASEAANRQAVADYRLSKGKSPNSLHAPYLSN